MRTHTLIEKNGKKVYRVRKKMPDGHYKSAFGPTLNDAYAKLNKAVLAYEGTHKDGTPTVEEYATHWLAIKKGKVRFSTYIGYASKVQKYIIEPLGNMPLSEVSSDDILDATKDLSCYSQSFCDEISMLYNAIFRAAVKAKRISDNPADELRKNLTGKKPVRNNQRQKALSDEQVDILLSAVKGLAVETFVRIGLDAGLRREETLALTWKNVEIDKKPYYIRVCKTWHIVNNRPVIEDATKTDASNREVPIPPKLAAFLQEKREISTSNYVIANSDGEPLSGSQWRNLWKQVTTRSLAPRKYKRRENGELVEHTVVPVLGEKAKHNPSVIYSIPFKVTSHMLRHTYVSRLLQNGARPKLVQKLVGHTNSKMTMDVYAEVTQDMRQIYNELFSEMGD